MRTKKTYVMHPHDLDPNSISYRLTDAVADIDRSFRTSFKAGGARRIDASKAHQLKSGDLHFNLQHLDPNGSVSPKKINVKGVADSTIVGFMCSPDKVQAGKKLARDSQLPSGEYPNVYVATGGDVALSSKSNIDADLRTTIPPGDMAVSQLKVTVESGQKWVKAHPNGAFTDADPNDFGEGALLTPRGTTIKVAGNFPDCCACAIAGFTKAQNSRIVTPKGIGAGGDDGTKNKNKKNRPKHFFS